MCTEQDSQAFAFFFLYDYYYYYFIPQGQPTDYNTIVEQLSAPDIKV